MSDNEENDLESSQSVKGVKFLPNEKPLLCMWQRRDTVSFEKS